MASHCAPFSFWKCTSTLLSYMSLNECRLTSIWPYNCTGCHLLSFIGSATAFGCAPLSISNKSPIKADKLSFISHRGSVADGTAGYVPELDLCIPLHSFDLYLFIACLRASLKSRFVKSTGMESTWVDTILPQVRRIPFAISNSSRTMVTDTTLVPVFFNVLSTWSKCRFSLHN